MAEDAVDAGMDAGPVGRQLVEGAGGDEAFQRPLVDELRVDALAEIGEVAERPSPRASTRCSTAWAPTPLIAASE